LPTAIPGGLFLAGAPVSREMLVMEFETKKQEAVATRRGIVRGTFGR
jgi:hypothetical protein